ncbi:hypothetical protein Har1130_09415 [Haloarcula sp. CBA1130]|uniref:hypothetical protein n=1 Tax=unclassified Haloarcula TaxID=2624677 RepID=UPI0012457A9B|nr:MULTISPECIES: hypothetical protein [unclassified Haloarcula]KAA9397017.1 hypothetical protein Har1129_01655 [Haloarcula sp. CBA1129]KAA9402946.1 hypothetical protein Har1130_09415 [Haloarcula sp. CBA1130]
MVSRDTKLQIGVVSVVIVVSVLRPFVFPLGRLGSVAFFAGTNFVMFGGVHLYLALVDDSETIPVAARWRYVGIAAMVAVVAFLQEIAGQTSLGSVTLKQLLGGTLALAVVIYFLYEVRDGYLASRQ